uniref:Protein OPG070 n=1 Tax=Rousettus bat poxvirus TaxID=3141933 RepID=A0AAU7E200_9POXV
MVDLNTHDVHATAQQRHVNQETVFTRELSPRLKNTYLYHNYAYGWIPETAVWASRFADLSVTDFYPLSLGLLRKLDYMASLYRGPPLVYAPRLNTEFVAQGSFGGQYNDVFKRFSILPERQFISFLLLTSMPAYNLATFFKSTAFDPKKHTLFSEFFTTREAHVELARYMRHGGDYKPLFARLNAPTTGMHTIKNPGPMGRLPPSSYETLANLSAILYFTDYDPVLMFLAFYMPGYSATTKITPAVEFLMRKLDVRPEDVTLV